MARQKIDPEIRKNIIKAQKWIEDITKKDANEAETRTRILDIFGMLMGYDRYNHVKQEEQVRGAGEPMRCDFAIQIDQEESSKPNFLVEVKKVNMDLTLKHLGQAARYAIDIGCEWVLLTNSREWKLYHVSFTKPPQTKLIDFWNLIDDHPSTLAEKFSLICYKNIKKKSLTKLWDTHNVLTSQNLLKIFLSEHSIGSIRYKFKKENQVTVTPEDIVGAVRRMLNSEAAGEMEKIKISLPAKKQKKTSIHKMVANEEESNQEVT
jgi:predicted type IV restriction endonuclease